MADSCCPGNIPAMPTISTCPPGGSFRNAIRLPSSCQRKTWQLVTCQENCQLSSSIPSDCEPASCPSTSLPATSCVGFVCQPIGSLTACQESGTDHSSCLVNSCQPSCSESIGCQAKGYDAGPCQQSCCQEAVSVSRSCQAACGPSACSHTRSCQPSCAEATHTMMAGLQEGPTQEGVSGE
ncbi:keratin-associated protein 29-1 [Tamandua tetradactyla]|uniref:keratin-associated protein 29-1 n=1 Tax=Tamandua tetradactyla TaxID=48850 RepID=UPI004053EDEE